MKSETWKVNGCELNLDLGDADVMERYENAFEAMAAEEGEISGEMRQSEKIRAYCNLYRKLYNRIFGEGTSEKIFEGCPENTAVYDEVYYSFLGFVKNYVTDSARRRAEKLAKYNPLSIND